MCGVDDIKEMSSIKKLDISCNMDNYLMKNRDKTLNSYSRL